MPTMAAALTSAPQTMKRRVVTHWYAMSSFHAAHSAASDGTPTAPASSASRHVDCSGSGLKPCAARYWA